MGPKETRATEALEGQWEIRLERHTDRPNLSRECRRHVVRRYWEIVRDYSPGFPCSSVTKNPPAIQES